MLSDHILQLSDTDKSLLSFACMKEVEPALLHICVNPTPLPPLALPFLTLTTDETGIV